MNNNIGIMSSDNVDALFDGMTAGMQQTQQAFQNTMNTMSMFTPPPAPQQTGGTAPSGMMQPRRNDGYYQQTFSSMYGYGGGGMPQQPQQRPAYGYGYNETGSYNMYGQPTMNVSQDVMYAGFYNPAYGK